MTRNNWWLASVAALQLLLGSLRAAAEAQPIVDEHLVINWNERTTHPQGAAAGTASKVWRRACQTLGDSLSVGKGPWGFGAFRTVACARDGQVVFGKPGSGKGLDDWLLTVTDDVDGAVFVLLPPTTKGGLPGAPITKLTLPSLGSTVAALADRELAGLVALALLDPMPMALQVTTSMVQPSDAGGTLKLTYAPPRPADGDQAPPHAYDRPEPPRTLVFYTLQREAGSALWRPTVVGSGRRIKLKGPKVTYALDPGAAQAASKGPLWAHDADGPGTRAEELAIGARQACLDYGAATARGAAALKAAFFATTASGYLGLRYGAEVFAGESLVRKSRMLGLLAEIRGGPLKGLRYYYDRVAEVSTAEPTSTGGEAALKLAWSRHVLGYQFDVEPGWLIDRITLTPKIGIWSFDTVAPIVRAPDNRVKTTQEFKVNKALSLGGEAGVEWESAWYTLRPWVGYDTGIALVKDGASVTSTRAGLDAYITAGPRFDLFGVNLKTTLLAFFIAESVALTDPTAKSAPASAEKIETLQYIAGYAGVGGALAW